MKKIDTWVVVNYIPVHIVGEYDSDEYEYLQQIAKEQLYKETLYLYTDY